MGGSDWPFPRQRHPAGSHGKVRAERIIIEGDVLCYSKDEEKDKVGVYIGESPVSEQCSYFEVQILHMGAHGAVSIGLCCKHYPLHKLPGWGKDSIGFHADDGRLYKARANGTAFGPKCGAGDKLGCGLKYDLVSPESHANKLPVFFSKNGKEIGCVWTSVPPGGLYPCIGLVENGDAVRLIPNATWPVDDDSHMVVDSVEEDWRQIHHLHVNGQILEYVGRGVSPADIGLAQARLPLNTTSHFFQLQILDPGKYCFITIGLTKKDYPKNCHPGWNKGSVAYHADDGRLFEGNTNGFHFGPPCDRGDVMGCGIIFPRDFAFSCRKCGGCLGETCILEVVDDSEGSEGKEAHDDDWPYADQSCSDLLPEDSLMHCFHVPNNLPSYIPGYDSEVAVDELEDERDVSGEEGQESEEDEENSLEPSKEKNRRVKVQVFFTHNGKMLGKRQMTLPVGGLYPTVGMGSPKERVRVDLHPLTG